MAFVRQGSCIGVLYTSPTAGCKSPQCQPYSGRCHCVHNGRFVGAVTKIGNTFVHVSKTLDTTKLKSYQGIILRHWNIRNPKNKNSIFLEFLFLPISRLENVAITPFRLLDRPVPPPGNPCSQPTKGSVRKPNTIYPGDCIGIRFRYPNNDWDIKNDKYLFYQRGGNSFCPWNTKKQNNPDKVWYAHWIVRKAAPHFLSVASNRGPKSLGKETAISLFPITGYNPAEGTPITLTFLNRTSITRKLTYK
ncbi:hypothetical protein EDM56_07795 [Brevibacillus fluminis]|uniref:Uncharacterized protein n=1 Tax=Brevibacillus fluminis TaxID=511487 RepID=A0A3M8DTV7_9BACL|nr:hypothetical protein EDM56_07795 [Brevibacillus fluminis]